MSVKKYLKKCISTILVYIIQGLKLLNERFTGNAFLPNPNSFEDLTPVGNADEDLVYAKTLSWALDNPNIRNLALTGPYGSGKSSILKTFELKHPEYKYLNISLASFDEISADDEQDRKRIEISILQQIFYRVSGQQMPDSRFKRIKATKNGYLLFQAIWLLFCVIAGIFLFKPTFFDRISWWPAFKLKNNDLLVYLSGSIFLTGVALILKNLLRNYNSARFHKLNLTSGEIELAGDVDASILNKHLDEILYFFEKTGYNVIALEDLDRFEDPEKLFSKLRELNNIINNSSQINHKVTFVYALKDDVFINDERTKFFDFFIPVIPVINSSNSGELLLKKFQFAKAQGKLTDNFLMNVTFFIEDMRQLKNVFNEYIIYKNKLKLNLTEEKLFSMILYKNFYPTDFANLNVNKGLIYGSFDNKREIVNGMIITINEQIANARTTITELEGIHLLDLNELRSVYLYALIKALPDSYRFDLGGNSYTIAQLNEDSVFDALTKENNIKTITVQYGGWRNSNLSFKTVENTIDPKRSYQDRIKQVSLKFNQETEKLKQQIGKWQEEIANLEHLKLADIIERNPEAAILPELEKERILIYLLRHGYIDETYQSYISHFYEGTITRTDMEFVFSVKNHLRLPADYDLVKIDQLIKKLQPSEFRQREVLNYQFVDFLAENNLTYKTELLTVVKQLSDKQPVSLKFIDDYLRIGKLTGVFFKALCKQWPDIWDELNTTSNFTKERLDDYLKLIVKFADTSDLKELNKSGRLKKSIQDHSQFLTLFPTIEDDGQIKKMLKELSIKFRDLEFIASRKELFDHIYQQSYYEINETMIQTIISHYADQSKTYDLVKANYSAIRNSGCELLNNYIGANINEYLGMVLFSLPDNTLEAEQFYLELLNNNDIEPDDKISLIEKIETSVSTLTSVDPSLWGALLEHVRVLPTWKNVSLRFLETSSLDGTLLEYLDTPSVYGALASKRMLTIGTDAPTNEQIAVAILTEDRLSDSAYAKLIAGIPWTWNSLNMEKVSASKVNILLQVKKVNMTLANYQTLKTHFDGKNVHLVENDFVNYKKLKAQISFDESDYRLLYASQVLTGAQKKMLLTDMNVDLINSNRLGELITTVVYKQRMLPLAYPLLVKLISFNNNTKIKVELLNQHLQSIDNAQLTTLLNALHGNYAKITERGKQPSLPGTPENWALANFLDSSDYVSSIKPIKDHIVINTWRK
ncbi:hypothetical protein BDD43_0755 [Mucilaginibacter gracilis]|uniref:YobI-like P-loop NTPase domain-containing protein n=1 Tax=Mucilaginibacter gracilis TaxID=423350 RepID=A0A495IV87_9SPHI|nr:hypothetical protein BDD43_0755 [Mucilaginibacter gracilis]